MLLPELISNDEADARMAALKHPHVDHQDVLEKIVDFYFTSYGPTTICVLTMWNEFRVVGEGHVIHPLNLDADRELGKYMAFNSAVRKASVCVAYELACQLAGSPLTSEQLAQAERQATPRPHTADVNFTNVYGVKELPAWKSHKIVWAAKIINMRTLSVPVDEQAEDSGDRWFLEGGGLVKVDPGLLLRGGAEPIGGYFVRYEDGYESWSPCEAFEAGYTRLG